VRAKISEVKARLSAYLRQVRAGETVVVLDRQTPVAQLVPIDAEENGLRIDGPRAPWKTVRSMPPVRLLRPLSSLELLCRDRGPR